MKSATYYFHICISVPLKLRSRDMKMAEDEDAVSRRENESTLTYIKTLEGDFADGRSCGEYVSFYNQFFFNNFLTVA